MSRLHYVTQFGTGPYARSESKQWLVWFLALHLGMVADVLILRLERVLGSVMAIQIQLIALGYAGIGQFWAAS